MKIKMTMTLRMNERKGCCRGNDTIGCGYCESDICDEDEDDNDNDNDNDSENDNYYDNYNDGEDE